ncbi:MAG: ABC transporter substrate-binding protein [Alphaproteobacteria bacterium]
MASDKSNIKIGWLGPQSSVGVDIRASAQGVQAYVKYSNDQGGLYGHKLELSVYDTQSNSSAVLASARKAVGDGVRALISNDVCFDTAAPYLAENKVPVFGFGISLGFYGKDHQTFFSPMGNWIAFQSNVGMKYLVDKGSKKIAVLSDPNPGNANAAHAIANAVPTVGGTLVYENYGVDGNTGALLAVAQTAKDKGGGRLHELLRHRAGATAGQPQPDQRQGRRAQRVARLLAGHPQAVRRVDRRPHSHRKSSPRPG